ncbi:CLUMA_CG002392, isoform A, partial [Clunio marinus]
MQTEFKNTLYAIMKTLTNGLLKFLTRFSGRRRIQIDHKKNRSHIKNSFFRLTSCQYSKHFAIPFTFALMLCAICDVTDACRSRTVIKPRTTPAPTSSPRPNITFHTYKCPEAYATWYCLNGATCFA